MRQNKLRIDLRDLWRVKRYSYRYQGRPGNEYVVRSHGGENFALHREIMNAQPGQIVDHINGNKLDNRRCNLRITTRTGNNQNSSSRQGSSSQWKGVYKIHNTSDKVWVAKIVANNKSQYLGCFAEERDAATVYNFAAANLHGQFAKFNTVPQPWLEQT